MGRPGSLAGRGKNTLWGGRQNGWLAVGCPPGQRGSACLEGPGGQNTPSFRLQIPWGLAAFGAPTWMTSIMPTWAPVLGRPLGNTRPGHHQGSFSGLAAGTGDTGGGSSRVKGMDGPHPLCGLAHNLSSWGLKFPTYKMGLGGPALRIRDRGDPEPPSHSEIAGAPPPPRLTGWQGCHGGGDQALDAQGAEGATQEAAGEGQELGTGVIGHCGKREPQHPGSEQGHAGLWSSQWDPPLGLERG